MNVTTLKDKKILFTDIDGVLNNLDSKTCYYFHKTYTQGKSFDIKNVNNLVRVAKRTGCIIMISSNWRLDKNAIRKVKDRATGQIKYSYNCLLSSVNGKKSLSDVLTEKLGYEPLLLPEYPGNQGKKGLDIKTFIEKNHLDINNVAAVDDVQQDFYGVKFFKTEMKNGLTSNIANDIIDFFDGEEFIEIGD